MTFFINKIALAIYLFKGVVNSQTNINISILQTFYTWRYIVPTGYSERFRDFLDPQISGNTAPSMSTAMN